MSYFNFHLIDSSKLRYAKSFLQRSACKMHSQKHACGLFSSIHSSTYNIKESLEVKKNGTYTKLSPFSLKNNQSKKVFNISNMSFNTITGGVDKNKEREVEIHKNQKLSTFHNQGLYQNLHTSFFTWTSSQNSTSIVSSSLNFQNQMGKCFFSKKASKDKNEKKQNTSASSSDLSNFSNGKAIPVNIYKDGKDPVILDDSEYPEWLFHCAPLKKSDYRNMDLNQLSLKEQQRFWRLRNRDIIKEKNASMKK